MQEIKNKIEAVLFITGRFVDLAEIAEFCKIGSIGSVKEAMNELLKDYSKKEGSLEIIQENGKYKLNIKRKYNHLSTSLISSCEFDPPTQATLAIIAYKQPALQSEIIKIRGSTAYDHIKTLRQEEFLTSEKKGRTRLLKLAPKFYDYFDVVEETLHEKFRDMAEKQEQKLEEKKLEENNEESFPFVEEKESETKEENKEERKAQKVVVEVNTEKTKEEEKKEEVEKVPTKVLANLDADDFGS